MLRVCIVDDDPLVVQSLQTIIAADGHFAVCGTCTGGEEFLQRHAALQPDLVLMDIRMKGMSGLDAAAAAMQQNPRIRIIFLTTFADDEYIIRALRMGAGGYLLKQDHQSIIPALLAVGAGQKVYGSAIGERLPEFLHGEPRTAAGDLGLNERELAIVELVAQGLSNREISARVFLGEGTVRNYISVILEKLDLRDRTQLAVFYYRRLV